VISGAEADLLDIMRRKILGLAAGRDYASGLPGCYLEVMDLQPLLSLVGMLGRRRMVVDNDSDRRNSQRIVFAAAGVLADWPNNFLPAASWNHRRQADGLLDGNCAREAWWDLPLTA